MEKQARRLLRTSLRSWWPLVEDDAETVELERADLQGWSGWSQVWRVVTGMGDTELYFRP